MPTYWLKHPVTGESRQLTAGIAEYASLVKGTDPDGYDLVSCDGELWRRDHAPGCGIGATNVRVSGWPIESVAAAVAPEDVPAEMEHCRRNGVAVNFTRDGRPIFENHAHRKAALKAMGLTDKLGYG